MGLSERIIGLTKYLVTLPKTKISVFLILVVSIVTGGIVYCLQPGMRMDSVVYAFLDGDL